MQSANKESFFNNPQKFILVTSFSLIIIFFFTFKNLILQPSLLLKNLGDLSLNPEIAFKNDNPTFLEFYAEWCEVCKEMAPKISVIKDEYEKDINFVFLNVDNPQWENYIKKFNVNGIPQINLFDSEANLEATFIGKQDEMTIKKNLAYLNDNSLGKPQILNSEFSPIRENKNSQATPRSHG